MLAQASLGLLLFERQEQESRASLSNGEDSHNLKLRDKASLNFYLLDFDIKSSVFFQRADNHILLINHFPRVYVIIYLGLVIFYYFGGYDEKSLSLCITRKRLTSGLLIICFKNVSGFSQPIRNVGKSVLTYLETFFGRTVSRTDLQSDC